LVEINARQWLGKLRLKHGAALTLLSVPDEEWLELKHLGFDAVWLMGVWKTGEAARRIARQTESVLKAVSAIRPDYKTEDIGASPYAVYDYSLSPELGRTEDLQLLREKLNGMGLALILDFVPNHTAIDHPLVGTCPDCFVQADHEEVPFHPDWFFEPPSGGACVAYGRDPNFPSWRDTAQLNYFNPKTRALMLETLLKIAEVCDGVRCDMVMLSLNDVHDGTWGWLMRKKGFSRPEREFWPQAIAAVKERHPHFNFLAEVYWGLEWRLQEMGFDYTYDKVLYDRLRCMGPADIKGHLRAEKLYQKRSVRFIENHDEQPAVSAFGKEKSMAAAIAVSTLRGMRLFHHGQIAGLSVKIPVQYLKCDFEADPQTAKFYTRILKIADHPAFHGGEWALVEPRQASAGNQTFANILCWTWTQRRTMKLVAVNYSNAPASARLAVSASPAGNSFTFFDELEDIFLTRSADEIRSEGLFVELPPYGAHLLDLEF